MIHEFLDSVSLLSVINKCVFDHQIQMMNIKPDQLTNIEHIQFGSFVDLVEKMLMELGCTLSASSPIYRTDLLKKLYSGLLETKLDGKRDFAFAVVFFAFQTARIFWER